MAFDNNILFHMANDYASYYDPFLYQAFDHDQILKVTEKSFKIRLYQCWKAINIMSFMINNINLVQYFQYMSCVTVWRVLDFESQDSWFNSRADIFKDLNVNHSKFFFE